MNNRVQELFNELVERYNLRAITIEGETWYGINDLPLTNVNMTYTRLRKQGLNNFVDKNTRTIKPSDISSVTLTDSRNSSVTSSYSRNFDTVANFGETFGNFTMVNFLIMNSRLGAEYKIELIEILDKIRANGYYIDENITSEQVEKLEQEIAELKAERTKKVYGSTDIVKMIKVPNLLSSTLFRYMAEEMKLGTYDVEFGNVNRTFVPNEDFTERAIKIGIARGGKGRDILFYKDFAECFNNCKDALKRLYEINQEEIAIRNKGKEKRRKNMPF